MRVRDVLAVGAVGLRTRRLRAALSALGIAIGIASMVAVLGISASSKAELLNRIEALGTNLLTVQAGQSFFDEAVELPVSAPAKVGALDGVADGAALYAVPGATVRRTGFVDAAETLGLSVRAADLDLTETLGVGLASGSFLTRAGARHPTVVLGAIAAERLGIVSAAGRPQVLIGDDHYTVVGVLEPAALDGSVDRSALIGLPIARRNFGAERHATAIHVRTADDRVAAVRKLLAATANPQAPEEVEVSRPSDALEARAAAKGAFTALLLGLGAVALLVGGIGIANVMVISVLERRAEIGLRRALGATRRDVAAQFVCEALILAALGGLAGAALGTLVTATSSATQAQPVVVPPLALLGGVIAALLIGALASLYPAARASRLSPTEALRTA